MPADHRANLKENKIRDEYLDIARELKTIAHEGDGDTKSNWCTWNNPPKIDKRTRRFRNQRTSRVHPSIIKISKNT